MAAFADLRCLVQGCHAELTSHAIYINRGVTMAQHGGTVFHEYGHFLMGSKRGWTWPVAGTEYLTLAVPFSHKMTDVFQFGKQAYLEGWADFYGAAVQGWHEGNPYSGHFYADGHPEFWFTQPPSFTYSMTSGYNSELLTADALFALYDPTNATHGTGSPDNIQIPFSTLLDAAGDQSVTTTSEYINALAHRSSITDEQRNAAISVMTLAKMNPVESYGNVTMKFKNNFGGGLINIDNVDVNTSATGGETQTTELWMSKKRLVAEEQVFQGYQYLFAHTNSVSPQNTWRTEFGTAIKSNFTETWNTYTDNLTAKANFDKVCNTTLGRFSYDQIELGTPEVFTTRSSSSLLLTAPDITQSGVISKFNSWNDGSTENPRTILVTENKSYTGRYKALLVSGSSQALANASQRKLVRSQEGTLHMVYESGKCIWYTHTDGAGVWIPEKAISLSGHAANPTIAIRALPNGTGPIIAWEEAAYEGTRQHVYYASSTDGGTTWNTTGPLNTSNEVLTTSGGVMAKPTVQNFAAFPMICWQYGDEPGTGGIAVYQVGGSATMMPVEGANMDYLENPSFDVDGTENIVFKATTREEDGGPVSSTAFVCGAINLLSVPGHAVLSEAKYTLTPNARDAS